MTPAEMIRRVAIEYAHFLTTKCFYSITGYMMHDQITIDGKSDHNEYKVDELYDYWIENIYVKQIQQRPIT